MTANETIEEMLELAKQCTRVVEEGYAGMDLERYKNFLDVLCHYTRTTEGRLRVAGEQAHTDELREYFAHEIEEEAGHHLLAQRDLERLGGAVSPEPHAAILELLEVWDKLGEHRIYGYLGARYVYENVIPNHSTGAFSFMETLGLARNQCTFINVHRVADIDHGESAEAICRRYLDEDPEAMLAGARAAAAAWQGMMRAAMMLPAA